MLELSRILSFFLEFSRGVLSFLEFSWFSRVFSVFFLELSRVYRPRAFSSFLELYRFLEFYSVSRVVSSFIGFLEFSRVRVCSSLLEFYRFFSSFLELSRVFSSFLGSLEFSRVSRVFSAFSSVISFLECECARAFSSFIVFSLVFSSCLEFSRIFSVFSSFLEFPRFSRVFLSVLEPGPPNDARALDILIEGDGGCHGLDERSYTCS